MQTMFSHVVKLDRSADHPNAGRQGDLAYIERQSWQASGSCQLQALQRDQHKDSCLPDGSMKGHAYI